jgi:8-amino-7-oxononanoate synthase
VYRQAREKLFSNIRLFTQSVAELNLFRYFPDYPVFYTHANNLYQNLQEKQILISCFPYPSPEDNLITRVIISSLHTPEDIAQISSQIRAFGQN